MTLHSTFTDEQMADAVSNARKATQWADGATLFDAAGIILAGHDADQSAIDDASRQVALLMDRS